MKRLVPVSEQIVIAVWVLSTTLWSAVVLWVTISYQGSTAASTWSARLIMLAAAGAITAAFVLLVRAVWRRALRLPLAGGRRNVWLARRPGWQLAVFFYIVLGLPQLAEEMWWAHAEHHGPPVGILATTLVGPVIEASFVALVMRVIFQRQIRNREMLEHR